MNHTHPPNPDDNLVRNVRNNMRTLAVNSTSRPRQIISQVLGDADESVSARKSESFPFPLPSYASDLVIPEELKIYYRGERLILFDIFDVIVGRVLICRTDRQKTSLEHSRSVYFDGTFKTVPSIFFQLFTIHAEYNNAILLSAFIFFQRKTRECYNMVWNILTTNLDLNFSSSMSDFESASINSFKEHFPNCRSSGCFFHFTQNIWRKIQSCGLSTDYINNGETRLYLKILSALAFCEPICVVSYYKQLEDYFNNLQIIPRLRQILTYFEDTYIGRFHPTEGSPPLFPIDF
ncbi:hypothetical protein RF11_03872 [Thelohanellus kitauei]|uniref:MULE transposase domain-containing protein n=1 Tax=Thelohanellus kitauei TaxID=669202 RepID=A0A0C2MJD8_THEKT|nr:hypothetical protein RF11_03872 [Thelohanellus kitauei]